MTIPELIEWLKIDEDRQIICDSIEQRFQVVKMLVENGFLAGEDFVEDGVLPDKYVQSILDGSENTKYMHPYVWHNSEDDKYYIDCYCHIWSDNETIHFSEIEFEPNLNIDLSEFV